MNLICNQGNAGTATRSSSNPALVVDPEQITLGGAVDGQPVRFGGVNINTPPEAFIQGRWLTKIYRVSGSASADGVSFSFNQTFALGQVTTNTNGSVSTSGAAMTTLAEAIKAQQNYQATYTSYVLNEFVVEDGITTKELTLRIEPNGALFSGTATESQLSYASSELFQPVRIDVELTKSDEFTSQTYNANTRNWYHSSVNDTGSAAWFGQPVAMETDTDLSFSVAITTEEHLPIT